MRILHYIPDFNNGTETAVASLRVILASTSRKVENVVLTSGPMDEAAVAALAEKYSVQIRVIDAPKGKDVMKYMLFGGKVKKIIKEVAPDVVHVHASWSYAASVVESKARHCRIVTVVSPYGGISVRQINTDFWKVKLPRLVMYQFAMMRKCTSAIVMSGQERDDIKSVGMKSHIEVMPQVLADVEQQEQLADALILAYRKALDSTYQNYITSEERHFVYDMVDSAVRLDAPDEQKEVPAWDVKKMSFRRIFFFAYDEDALPLLLEGAAKNNVTMPPVPDIAALPRYKNNKAKQRVSLYDMPSVAKHRLKAEQSEDIKAIDLITKAKSLGMKRMTLRQWTELYGLFRNMDFDEDAVEQKIKRMRLKRFTRKIQGRLTKWFNLPKGFCIIE